MMTCHKVKNFSQRRSPVMRSFAPSFCPRQNSHSLVKASKATSSEEPIWDYVHVQISPLPQAVTRFDRRSVSAMAVRFAKHHGLQSDLIPEAVYLDSYECSPRRLLRSCSGNLWEDRSFLNLRRADADSVLLFSLLSPRQE